MASSLAAGMAEADELVGYVSAGVSVKPNRSTAESC